MGERLKPNGYKVMQYAREASDELNFVILDMARFMGEGHVDPLAYHEHMWRQLGRVKNALTAVENILEV